MPIIQTLISWDTQLSADAVEWCPYPSKSHLLVCGTYQLVEGESQETSSRQGRLHLLTFQDKSKLIPLQSIDVPAVLDCKWAPELIQGKGILGVATAIGQLCLYKLYQDVETLKDELVEENKIDLPVADDGSNVLALSLDWSPSEEGRIAVSDSKGRVTIFQLNTSGLSLQNCWTAHQFESWTVHLDRFSPNICYSGGDDAKLRVYDLREDLQSAKLTSNQHSAGVTSFTQPNSISAGHTLLSGSYDEHILLWDTRQMKRPVHSTRTGGGVWRIRFNPGSEHFLLAACMYNGFHVFNRNLEEVAHYQEHASIAYGAHWNHEDPYIMATCSFYDHKLNISLFNKS